MSGIGVRSRAPKEPEKKRQGIQSIEVGVRLLDVLARSTGPMTLRDLSARAGMSSSKAHRYLVSLLKCGLVVQDQNTSRYDLGGMALRLGLTALSHLNVVRIATGAVVELNQRIDQTVLLSVWSEHGPTVVGWYDGSDLVICNANVGSVFPILRTATGRAFLGYLPRRITKPYVERELSGVVSNIPLSRLHTMGDVDRLIAEIRSHRLGITHEEFLPGLSAIAAPVFDFQGRIVAAVAMVGVRGTVESLHPGALAETLLETADGISRRLGFDPAGGVPTYAEWLEAGGADDPTYDGTLPPAVAIADPSHGAAPVER